ncbi:hypothetical protein BQ8482_400040 [Mesorhizobium delmotii]|uniref:Uncharacterized protein n=1 Tax=Mesorhizobium delmotii TaxID=1631247 RepID=A0A2P9AT32_9HYPH|nr:hypothetical protein BQ8482_400040 [Mesorhizobium delmotii]
MLDLIVTMDDATSTIYSAFLIEEEARRRACWGLWRHSWPRDCRRASRAIAAVTIS